MSSPAPERNPFENRRVVRAAIDGLKRGAARVEAWLAHRWAGPMLVAMVAALYVGAWARHELHPTELPAVSRTGWWTWSDQYHYLTAAQDLAVGRVTVENYHYPLGYSLLAAPFVRLMPRDPFLVPNLALVLVSAVCAWRLARMYFSRVAVVVAGVVFLYWHARLLNLTLVVPWNTTATQAALMAAVMLVATRPAGTVALPLGLIAAGAYLVRPADAACLAPLLVYVVLSAPGGWGGRIGSALKAGIPLAGAVVAVGCLNLWVFQTWESPYDRMSWEAVGFGSYPTLQKIFWAFVDGGPFFGETDRAFLFLYPWMLLVPAGVVAWCALGRVVAVVGVAAAGLCWALYLLYNDFVPSSFWRFSLIHYVSGTFPLLFWLALLGLAEARRSTAVGWAVGAGIMMLAIAGSVQLREETVASGVIAGRGAELPAERPLVVAFPGVAMERAREVRIDGRGLQESRDYHLPYVPTDLRMLLSNKVRGEVIALPEADGTITLPRRTRLVWGWDPTMRRLWRRGVGTTDRSR